LSGRRIARLALGRRDCAHRPALEFLGASRAQPHPVGLEPFPASRQGNGQISKIRTALKPSYRRLTVVSNIIAAKLDRFARTNFDRL
jgi:hypothetical protein